MEWYNKVYKVDDLMKLDPCFFPGYIDGVTADTEFSVANSANFIGKVIRYPDGRSLAEVTYEDVFWFITHRQVLPADIRNDINVKIVTAIADEDAASSSIYSDVTLRNYKRLVNGTLVRTIDNSTFPFGMFGRDGYHTDSSTPLARALLLCKHEHSPFEVAMTLKAYPFGEFNAYNGNRYLRLGYDITVNHIANLITVAGIRSYLGGRA